MAEIVNRKETRNTLIVSLNERKDYQDTVQKNLSFTQGSLIIDDKDFILCGQIEDCLLYTSIYAKFNHMFWTGHYGGSYYRRNHCFYDMSQKRKKSAILHSFF